MFGAFKPTAPLSGGLLWKIPYRLSSPQKLRHRRRLRRVDNVVSVLDTALKRQATSIAQQTSLDHNLASQSQSLSSEEPLSTANEIPQPNHTTSLQAEHLPIHTVSTSDTARHGRGSRQGDFLPTHTSRGIQVPSTTPLAQAARLNGTIKLLERWKAEMPREEEMLARDKYTMFDKKAKKYRKGVHRLPKWTRVSQRLNPPGF